MEISWVTLALIAPFLWAICDILIKFVRAKYIKNVIGFIIIISPISLLSIFLLFFGKFQIPNIKILIYSILTGICAFLGYYLFTIAIHKEEISRVLILYGTGPLFTLLIATFFLDEILRVQNYIAFALIIIGTFLISFRKIKEEFRFTKEAILVLISSLLFSLQSILLKLASELNFPTIIITRELSLFLLILTIFISSKRVRKKTKEVLSKLNKKRLTLIYSAETLGMIGLVFSYLAIQRAPVSLVTLLEGFEAVFVFIIALSLSLFLPHIIKEDTSAKTIIIKIISIVLMLGGLYLIAT